MTTESLNHPIDAAKAGDPPMPEYLGRHGDFEALMAYTDALITWGRQGWDAAAALRVEVEG